ncbi:glycosyltransferase family 4 protein [Subtercola sp. YIM 133946]|uniref:glycosyltransferase family 4 protein n=1 Tax=Subtercola sp. YIM 133946 TaxID=3118909 RepID=UPI002F95F86D
MRWIVGLTEYAGLTDYTGGIGTHYAALLPALAARGVEIDLVLFAAGVAGAPGVAQPGTPGLALPGTPGRALPGMALPGVPGAGATDARAAAVRLVAVHDLSRLPVAGQLVARAMLFRRYVARARYDAVFLPEWGGIGALLPRSAALVTNLATGIRLGDWIAVRRTRDFPLRLRFGRWLQHRLETRQIRSSRGVVPISRAVLAWNERAIQGLPPARVVRNCVDIEAVRRQATHAPLPAEWPVDGHRPLRAGWPIRVVGPPPEASPVGGEEPLPEGSLRGREAGPAEVRAAGGEGAIILFVGRLERRKGVIAAMQAFAIVAASQPTARLVLAGASGDERFEPTRSQLLAHLTPGQRERVVFLGHVPGDRLAAAMARAALVICPSLWEGFGNVALEAKAAGAPLVVTTGSGFDDFCRDGEDALMVPPGDSAALAGAALRLLEHPELGERLVAAATASLERFTVGSVAADLEHAVLALARSLPRPGARPASAPIAPRAS